MTGPEPFSVRLRSITFEEVVFAIRADDGIVGRLAHVRVGSGPSWRAAVRFPHEHLEEGASTGDELLDEEVRERAAEELARFAAVAGQAA